MRSALATAVAAFAFLAVATPALADTSGAVTTDSSTAASSSAVSSSSSTAASTPSTTPPTTPSSTAPTPTHVPVPAPDSRRVVVYYQKHYENNPQRTGYISALPLLTEDTGVDVVNCRTRASRSSP